MSAQFISNRTSAQSNSEAESLEESVQAVALPNEIPAQADLSKLPVRILHSGTIETLIGQNDDLMARLKVNLRRNGALEGQLIEQERVNDELTRANQSLLSEVQVLREKDHLLRDKTTRSEAMQSDLNSTIASLQTKLRASEIHVLSLLPASRFQRRIVRWVRPLVARLKNELGYEKRKVMEKNAEISDLKAKLNEEIQHSQGLQNQSMKDQTKLVEYYEAAIAKSNEELDKLRGQARFFSERAAQVEKATELRAEAENKIIYLERQIETLETQAKAFEAATRDMNARIANAEKAEAAANEKHKAARNAELAMRDQLEGLQSIWMETQKKLENSTMQQEALNRINQELSRQLKERRQGQAEEPAAMNFEEKGSTQEASC